MKELLYLVENFDVIGATPVYFKLFGTLRLLTNDNDALGSEIGTNLPVLRRLISLGLGSTQSPGVQAEAGRLLAAILANSSSSEVSIEL